MNILLVPDKFKGSLSSQGVIEALKSGILKAIPDANFYSALVSDGGDGFLDSVAEYSDSESVSCDTKDPLGRPIDSYYLYDPETATAYIEMAKTAGLELLDISERSPLTTSTYGTGIQIKHALESGAKRIFVGLGGSATNDAGMGIAAALGYSFLDEENNTLEPVGSNLVRVSHIIKPAKNDFFDNIEIFAINDVDNPLYGLHGAAHTYAAQKGASLKEIEFLDNGLKHLDAIVRSDLNRENAKFPGAGAAGGTAYGLMTFLGAEFIPGTAFVLELAGVPEVLREQSIDLIITGEGKIDDQTSRGKLISGIIALGNEFKVPVIAVCGALDADPKLLQKQGLQEVLEVRDQNRSLQYNMEHAAELVEAKIYDYLKGLIV